MKKELENWLADLAKKQPKTAEEAEAFFLEWEEDNRKLTEQKTMAEQALQQAKLVAAAEKTVLEAGGKNAKAILALADWEDLKLDKKGNVQGLDLESIKEEAPYLFTEKEEKMVGTGFRKTGGRKKENISETFKQALRR